MKTSITQRAMFQFLVTTAKRRLDQGQDVTKNVDDFLRAAAEHCPDVVDERIRRALDSRRVRH